MSKYRHPEKNEGNLWRKEGTLLLRRKVRVFFHKKRRTTISRILVWKGITISIRAKSGEESPSFQREALGMGRKLFWEGWIGGLRGSVRSEGGFSGEGKKNKKTTFEDHDRIHKGRRPSRERKVFLQQPVVSSKRGGKRKTKREK